MTKDEADARFINKNTEIITTKEHLDTLTVVETARKGVFEASKPEELDNSLITLVNVKEIVKQAKDKLKKLEAEPKKQIKTLEDLANSLENEIKEKFVELKKVDLVQKVNNETGEIYHKEQNNYEKHRFTYTPEKVSLVVDKEQLLTDKRFTKEITTTVIDEEALQEYISQNGIKELPTKELITPEKVGIQFSQIKNALGGIENEINK